MSEAVAEASSERARSGPCVLVFCGGKGGAGRTTFVASLASALLQVGLRVRLVDADAPTAGLTHLLENSSAEAALRSALVDLPAWHAQTSYAAVAQEVAAVSARPSFAPTPFDSEAAARRGAVRLALLAQMDGPEVDVMLVDAPAGIGDDAAALASGADGLIVVADPYSLHDGQERRLLNSMRAMWKEDGHAPLWLAVLVNRAPATMDGSDATAIMHWVDERLDRVAVVPLDVDALREGHPHDAFAQGGAVTAFAHDAWNAFDALLEPERQAWPEGARDRWRALATAKTRELGRVRARHELEAAVQRKWLERWPELENECRRLAGELERVRTLRAEEDARQGRMLEDLRQHGRALRAALEAAESRANARRGRALTSVGMGFACGALAAITATVWLAHGETRDVIAAPHSVAGPALPDRAAASATGSAAPAHALNSSALSGQARAMHHP